MTPVRQALLALAHLRNGDTYARLAAGFEVGIATAWRYGRGVTQLPLVSSQQVEWRPSHGIFSIRDLECDAGTGSSGAIARAISDVASGTGYEVWIGRAQELLLVALEVQIWDGPPDGRPHETRSNSDWTGPLVFAMECPSGELLISDPFGAPLTGIFLPDGPAHCTVEVFYTGRDEAVRAFRELVERLDDLSPPEQVEFLDAHVRGIERYLLRVFPHDDATPS